MEKLINTTKSMSVSDKHNDAFSKYLGFFLLKTSDLFNPLIFSLFKSSGQHHTKKNHPRQ